MNWYGVWSPSQDRWAPLQGVTFFQARCLAAAHLHNARKAGLLPLQQPDDWRVREVGDDGLPVPEPGS